MSHYSRNYNSPESRRKRSEKARHAVSCRKDRQNREPVEPLRNDLFELIVKNKISGKSTIVEINRGTRSNNFSFVIDGEHWRTCGMSKAEGLILRSLAKAQRSKK